MDHHRPARAHECVPRPNRRRADLGLQGGLGRSPGGRAVPDRGRGSGLLLRRRPEAAPGDRRLRTQRDRTLRDRDLPPGDPRSSEAGDRRRERSRGRGRARAPRALRHHHRRGSRPLRPGGPESRLLRRRLRHRLPGPHPRREAGAGGLVPLSSLRRRHHGALGSGESGGPGRASCARRSGAGRTRCWRRAPPRCAS